MNRKTREHYKREFRALGWRFWHQTYHPVRDAWRWVKELVTGRPWHCGPGYYLADNDHSAVEFYNGGWVQRRRFRGDRRASTPAQLRALGGWVESGRRKFAAS